jgi:type I restriction enzyme S subunit
MSRWKTQRLRFACKVNPCRGKKDSLRATTEVSFVPMEYIGEQGELALERVRPMDEVSSGYTYFEDNDVVFAKITPCFENGKGTLAQNLVNGVAFGTTELHVLRPTSDAEGRFIYYLTVSDTFRKNGESFMYGAGGQKRVPEEFVKNYTFPLPPLPVQKSIAAYLDKQTARIDELIAKKERQIELLQEKRQAIITRAVTTGIHPNVRMKDSGVEWIGEIPEGWEVTPIKHLGNIQNGYAFDSTEFVSEGTRVLKISNIQPLMIDWEDESFVDPKYFTMLKQFQVKKDDLVFALTRPIISGGIKAAIIENDEEILLNQRNAVFRPIKNINMKWMYYIIIESNFVHEFEMKIDKTGQQPNISAGDIGDIKIPLPPINMQSMIIENIDKECNKIDCLIQKTINSISLLREYRSSLITAAVSGQIDVENA